MPLHDNGFSNDNEAERLERLRVIQDNRATTLPLMAGIHSDVSAWMQNCHSVYDGLVQHVHANSSDVRANTVQRRLANRALRQQLLLAKKQILAGYAGDDVRRRAFDIEGILPADADTMNCAVRMNQARRQSSGFFC